MRQEDKSLLANAASKGSWALQTHFHPETGAEWTPFDQLMAALVLMEKEGYAVVEKRQLDLLESITQKLVLGDNGLPELPPESQ